MRRFDTVLDRILELGGKPASRDCSTLRVGHDIPEALRSDLALEEALITNLREASSGCETTGDRKTGDLLAGILRAELEYADWLRAQLDQAERGAGEINAPTRKIRGGPTRAHDKVVACLNEVLKIEMSAITQVYYHSRMFETWGIKRLHEFHAAETLEKTYRSVAMLRRLLALDGMPASEGHGKLTIGNEVPEMLRCDFKTQESLIPLLHRALDCCDSHGDQQTRELLSGILDCEQKHADWLEAQFDQMKQQGAQAYIQSQM
ncbi:MAG: ferritin-like domain-containing protein, partial [Acidobacteriota bacterium]